MTSDEIEKKRHSLATVMKARGFIDPDADWQFMTGGRSNLVWRVTGETNLVCKLFLDNGGNPLFANEPLTEYDCLTALAGQNIAPVPEGFFDLNLGPVLLYRYIDGKTWSKGVEPVADIVQRVQRIRPISGLRILSSEPEHVQDHSRGILEKTNTDLARLVASIEPALPVFQEPEECLLHTDIVPGNLIESPDGLKLIDWQCPAVGDPVLDMVTFVSPAMHFIYTGQVLDEDEQYKFLKEFSFGLQTRYAALAPLYHWRMAAYCAWKSDQGFDGYEKAAELEIEFCRDVSS